MIQYDPTLLTISGAHLGADAPANSQVMLSTAVPGYAIVSFFSPIPMWDDPADIISLDACVPAGAAYGAVGVLDIVEVRVNEGGLAATADDAVEVVAFVGDATGDGGTFLAGGGSSLFGPYSSLDAQRIFRVSQHLDSGFEAYPNVDPMIIGDVTGDGTLSPLDCSHIMAESLGYTEARLGGPVVHDSEYIPPLPVMANAQPVANVRSVTTAEDGPLAITLTGDDGDPEVVQTLTYTIATNPSHGTLSGFVPATGAVTYSPNPDYNGTDSFTFTVIDDDKAGPTANLTSDPAAVTITITPVNKRPTANAQTVTAVEDATQAITLTGEDGDPMPSENQHLTFAITEQPVHGTITSFDPNTGQVVYVPDADYSGSNTITVHPLTNPGAETGDLSGWDYTYNVSAVSGPRSLGTGTINATEGTYWFMGQKPYTYNTSIAYGVIYMDRTVDVSSFSSIASIHFGGDYSAHGEIADGVGSLQVINYFYLWYYDKSGAFLGSTFSFEEPWHDVTGATYNQRVDHLDSAVPSNTACIHVYLSVQALITNTAGSGTVSGTVLAGIDNLFMDVNGSRRW